MASIEKRFIEEKRETVMGVPIQWGTDENGEPFINRFAYSSVYSDYIKEFVEDERFSGGDEAAALHVGRGAGGQGDAQGLSRSPHV